MADADIEEPNTLNSISEENICLTPASPKDGLEGHKQAVGSPIFLRADCQGGSALQSCQVPDACPNDQATTAAGQDPCEELSDRQAEKDLWASDPEKVTCLANRDCLIHSLCRTHIELKNPGNACIALTLHRQWTDFLRADLQELNIQAQASWQASGSGHSRKRRRVQRSTGDAQAAGPSRRGIQIDPGLMPTMSETM